MNELKILLVGNYRSARQPSMLRFASVMQRGLREAGHEVRLVHPPELLGRLCSTQRALEKWIGYVDRFLLYPLLLRVQVRWADVVHICDQANAGYVGCIGGAPHIITCHDLLAARAALGDIPGVPTGWTGRIYQRWILHSLRKARMVVCVSRQTQEDVKRMARLSGNRLGCVPNALNYPYAPMSRRDAVSKVAPLDIRLRKPFLLHVGGNDWYKNRCGLLRIFHKLIGHSSFQDTQLVLAGAPLSTDAKLLRDELGLSSRVHELTGVSNEILRALYSLSQALIFPSLYEGFGWPIVEAQACGCPVITTNRAPMTEVSGGAAIYIDPTNPDAAAMEIASAWGGRHQLIAEGLANTKRYDLRTMINGYMTAYLRARTQSKNPEKGRSCAV